MWRASSSENGTGSNEVSLVRNIGSCIEVCRSAHTLENLRGGKESLDARESGLKVIFADIDSSIAKGASEECDVSLLLDGDLLDAVKDLLRVAGSLEILRAELVESLEVEVLFAGTSHCT